ncbi:peptidase S1 and S6 chymotrypsin/Hap [Flammeovirgaceae bacterium 311]|nr:peptidase S1 and S6 chymotrypsin/Hap [Flammeovirgaceae bacterium 311]
MKIAHLILALTITATAVSCGEFSSKNAELANDSIKHAQELILKEKESKIRELEARLEKNELQEKYNSETSKLQEEIKSLKQSASVNNLTELYKKNKNAVFTIYTKEKEGVGQGTCFVIDPSGLALTNYHVLATASNALVVNEAQDKFMITEVLEYSEENDYVLFRLGPNDRVFDYVPIANLESEIGSKCFAIGNPRDLTLTLSEGLVSGYREANSRIQTTASITNGSSGGPLFNQDGEVIGITTSGITEAAANLNFAVNIKEVAGLYRLLNLEEKESTKRLNPASGDLTTILAEYQKSLLVEDIGKLYSFYADSLDRFHALFNISKNTAIEDHIGYLKRYKIEELSFDRESFHSYEKNGEHYAFFTNKLKLTRRKDNRRLSYITSTVVIFDMHKRIKSVFENILERK